MVTEPFFLLCLLSLGADGQWPSLVAPWPEKRLCLSSLRGNSLFHLDIVRAATSPVRSPRSLSLPCDWVTLGDVVEEIWEYVEQKEGAGVRERDP